ncbi:uncharacterized protein VP01_618g5 [Puccinia sorghi]|uniref:Uncharacterized protein n=1 Tax=Puccinia sorghi TaxID=27349 RepID=A0A0L6UIV1_9BASI|nr:uncharacterized protein VP01_618g5 [Puccinia sorghi]
MQTTRIRTHFQDLASIAGGTTSKNQQNRDNLPFNSSTKTFHAHLLQIHGLADPNCTKKLKMNQSEIDKWCHKGVVLPKVELNNETLNLALVYMIANRNLPFSIVRHKSFQDFICLLNESAKTTSQAVIATHSAGMYHLLEETIKESYLAKHISIYFTKESWISPNVTAFVAVTAHFFDKNFQIHDLTISISHIEGSSTHILSCVAHAIKLTTKMDANSGDEPNPMDISLLVLPPDGANINFKTIIKSLNGLCTRFQFLPQQQEQFELANSETANFSLSPAKCDHTQKIMKLLEPLNKAKEMLCASNYPKLNSTLPVYFFLIEHLNSVHWGLYSQDQLIRPSNQMIEKIDEYLKVALKKPIYICSMVLDLNFKTVFWKNHEAFILEDYQVPIANVVSHFKLESQKFYDNLPQTTKSDKG